MQKPIHPPPLSARLSSFAVAVLLLASPLVIHANAGRQKDRKNGNANRQVRQANSPIAEPSNTNSDEGDEVVRVTSNLVPVPATVVDSRGVAITNLKADDFELLIDVQPGQINAISRSETPVHIAMLFDNSGRLSAMRQVEKQ